MLFRDVSIPFSLLCAALRIFCFQAAKIGFKDPDPVLRMRRVTEGTAVFFLSLKVVTAKPSYFAKHTQCW